MNQEEKDTKLEERLVRNDFGINAFSIRRGSYSPDKATERLMYQREERILRELIALPYLMPCCDY